MINVKIVPYTHVDGVPTYRDSEIRDLYNMVSESGYGSIFNFSDIITPEIFLSEMKKHDTFLHVLYINDTLAGIAWLNRIENRMARLHWSTFSGISIKDKLTLAIRLCELILHMKDDSDEFIFDVLVGYTPSTNSRAIQFCVAAGGHIAGEVPNLLWSNSESKSVPGTIIYYIRGNANEDLQ